MKQHIAPQVLRVNGQLSPCECVNEANRQIICSYCVQANLILWDRAEHPDQDKITELCAKIKKLGIRRVARNMGIPATTVKSWLSSENIKEKYIKSLSEVLNTLG